MSRGVESEGGRWSVVSRLEAKQVLGAIKEVVKGST